MMMMTEVSVSEDDGASRMSCCRAANDAADALIMRPYEGGAGPLSRLLSLSCVPSLVIHLLRGRVLVLTCWSAGHYQVRSRCHLSDLVSHV